MQQWNTIQEALDFAIEKEQEAVEFYQDLATRVDNEQTKKTLIGFAKEEAGHKAKLEGIKNGKRSLHIKNEVFDLKMSDYLVDVEADQKLDYQDALILAMKREKAAFRLYSDLAEQVEETDLALVFLALAQEEAGHKLRFETEYDDKVLTEN